MSAMDMSAGDRESYDDMYRSTPAVWSGRPNRQLVVEAGDLAPGTALDAGCGEGGDAVWLAERGWRVTAVDFSTVALDRGAAQARRRGIDDRIEWRHADLHAWAAPEGHFDLVTAHYLHSRGADRRELFGRLAAAVAPGGTLLVVGHVLTQADAHVHRRGPQHGGDHGREHGTGPGNGQAHDPDLYYTAEDVAAVLDPDQWDEVVTEIRAREPAAATRTGNPAPDTVFVARRRSGAGSRAGSRAG